MNFRCYGKVSGLFVYDFLAQIPVIDILDN